MPTRVLALCGEDTRPYVQLIESKGRKGRYLALNHCWGSNEKLPLRTTSKNYQVHQGGIPFRDLPKTFQDTVEFAQGIGIRYVWIDSLCIIQGDSQDWHSEAAKMGDVYWNAALVVAASGAKDSSEGLFISDRPLSTILRLPYRMGGECKGTFNMMRLPQGNERHPGFGPLEKRAWTLRERYLARRLIAFMPDCISWACKKVRVTESGQTAHLFTRDKEWSVLLENYTKRSLTFASDRVEALRGIAAFLQRYQTDRYIPEYGVWERDLVFQLLWFSPDACFDEGRLASMPSWGWAATKNAKIWPPEYCNNKWDSFPKAEEMPERLVITSAGHLLVFGHLGIKKSALSYVQGRDILDGLKLYEIQDLYPKIYVTRDDFSFLIQDKDCSHNKTVLGIARFDDDRTKTYTHVCFF